MVSLRAFVLLLVSACGPSSSDRFAGEKNVASAADTTRFTLDDFQSLRFIEGTWRGSASGGTAFFESYRFLDDSTISMTSWKDSTMTSSSGETLYRLRGGAILVGKDGRLVRRSSEGYAFVAPTYSWTFRPESANRWMAQVSPTITYVMDRLPDQ